jgi:hypothetical protein
MVETWIRLTGPGSELTGSQSGDAFERAMEVALVGKAQSKRDLCDRRISIRELRAGSVNARPADELTDGASMLSPEDTCDMHGVHPGDCGCIVQTDRFRKASLQRFFNPPKPGSS